MSLSTLKTPFRFLCVLLLALSTASCGFHLRNAYMLPKEMQKLSLTSFDQYGQLTRDMKYQLELHNINIVPVSVGIPNINLNSESFNTQTISLYQNGGSAQYRLNYQVSYTVSVPNTPDQTFTTTVTRSFLDNPLTALAKSIEEDQVENEMRNQASQQILRQLARMTVIVNQAKQAEIQQQVEGMLENDPQPAK